MSVSEHTFQQLALEDPEGHWELYCGNLRQKPGMTFLHNHAGFRLTIQLATQLDLHHFDVRTNAGHVRRSPSNYFIPDVSVIPLTLAEAFRERRDVLEWYDAPLPLVVEIWSPSTANYDVDTKLSEYQRRGDLEIWLLHPFDRTLIVWRKQVDGSYVESHHAGGSIQLFALPQVTIDLQALFD